MKKFNQLSFTLFTINYIVGFGFITTITSLIKTGFYGFIIFAIVAFIAFSVSLVFSRLSNEFKNEYGGSYAYAKNTFNRGVSFFIGWNQYIQGPILSSTAPLFLADAASYFTDNKNILWIIQGVSVLFFCILILISTLGIKLNKKIVLASSIIKWSILLMALILSIILSINSKNNTNNESLTPYLFFSNILSFMYAFGGVEDVASMAKDVKFKNFKRILMTAFAFILSFYFVFYLFLIFVDGSTINNISQIFKLTLGTTGLIIFVVGLIFNGISSKISVNIATSRKLVSLAEDGFLFKFITKKNQYDEYKNAIWFNAIITIISLLFFWLIPKLLGIESFFNSVINLGSIAFLIQYFFTFLIAIIASKKGIIKRIKIWEQIIYIIAMFIIFCVLIVYMFPFITNENWDINNTITISSYFGFNIIGIIIFMIRKLKNKKEYITFKI